MSAWKSAGTTETLTEYGFEYFRALVKRHSSINLDDNKRYLVESRLLPLARRERFDTVGQLVEYLRRGTFGPLHRTAVEAILTTETSFFRDVHPFDALRNRILPELDRRRAPGQAITLWSAACSSGQEPYSIAMIVNEVFPPGRGRAVRVLASDLSYDMLEKAKNGLYRQVEINRGLPARLLINHFEQHESWWRLKPSIRKMVQFFQLNLTEEWTTIPPVDIVFLRNVLIYFDIDVRKLVLERVRRHLRHDGYLILGSAETTLNLDQEFDPVQLGRSVVYRRKNAGSTAG